MPRSRRRSQGEDGRDNGLRSHGKSCSRKQHQCRAAPRKRSRLPPPKEGLVGIVFVHVRLSAFLLLAAICPLSKVKPGRGLARRAGDRKPRGTLGGAISTPESREGSAVAIRTLIADDKVVRRGLRGCEGMGCPGPLVALAIVDSSSPSFSRVGYGPPESPWCSKM